MNTYTDTIAKWYADAEKVTKTNLPNRGDTLIYPRYGGDGYSIETNPDEWTPSIVGNHETVRILARAPKPKPAWHDAVAVLANHRDYADERRTVWVQIGGDEYDRVNIEGDTAAEHHLVNVTPLIEAKVTDEMRARAIAAYEDDHGSFAARIDATLNAALGIEAE